MASDPQIIQTALEAFMRHVSKLDGDRESTLCRLNLHDEASLVEDLAGHPEVSGCQERSELRPLVVRRLLESSFVDAGAMVDDHHSLSFEQKVNLIIDALWEAHCVNPSSPAMEEAQWDGQLLDPADEKPLHRPL